MRQPKADDLRVHGAFNGTSFSPEKREQQRVQDYLAHMGAIKAEFDVWRTEENAAEMDEALEAYREKYVRLYNAYLDAHSGVVSTMIAGASNFPVRQMEKRNKTVDIRWNELVEWNEKRLEKLRRLFNPRLIANAPITADDPVAVEKLRAKIAEAEQLQEKMKAANKIVKSKKLSDEQKIEQLRPLVGEKAAHQLLQPDFMGRVGFADYRLTNNNANIRRMKARVVELEALAELECQSEEHGDIKIERNTEAVRLQVFFPDKPATAVRDAMKRNGFRWSPSNGCWQRHLNQASEWALKDVWPIIAKHYDVGTALVE